MINDSTIEALQGELERHFDLTEMKRLSAELLGFDPERVGGTRSKGAFARSLVGYCLHQEALDALVDAILLSAEGADPGLRRTVRSAPNGELKPGTKVGRLRVVKKIGEGGLSIVYLAESDGEGDQKDRAALKVIRPQYARDRAAVHRFTTMSRVMQHLDAPGLAPILEVGQLEDARPWVAAEYLSGQSLAERIKRTGGLHINEARPIFAGVLQGLMALHARGLAHGDIKAENVFVVRPQGSGAAEPTGVLVDAGADRLLTRSELGATVTGLLPVIGTAKALAPEQARGLEPDHRADIYQMGTMMYETLAGRPPFEGDCAIDVIALHLSGTPAPPSQHARKGWVSEELDLLVLRALAKEPAARFRDAKELLRELDALSNRPAAQKPLDEAAFADTRRALLETPTEETLAERIESLANESGAWARAAEVLNEAARKAQDGVARLSLLFRVARIYDSELNEGSRAEAAYRGILEIDAENAVALRGIENARRAAGDYEGLLEVLLDRVEREEDEDERRKLLHEVAVVYEKRLGDSENALIAWTQALISDPHDSQARREITRLSGPSEARWNEVLEMLAQAAQDTHAALFADEDSQRASAQAELAQAQVELSGLKETLQASLDARTQELSSQRVSAGDELERAQQTLEAARSEVEALDEQLETTARAVEAASQEVDQTGTASETAHAQAEAAVEAYETLEAKLEGEPDESQAEELSKLADRAEELVEAASQAEAAHEAAQQQAEQVRSQLADTQGALERATTEASQLEQHVAELKETLGEHTEPADYTEEEQARLEAARKRVTQAERALSALDEDDDGVEQRERDLADLAQTYVLMGRWYNERLNRPDFALSCFSQALSIDDQSEGAYDGMCELYRASQAWSELAKTLLQRADRAKSPGRGRDHRAEAAQIIAHKLGDQAQARMHFGRVLDDDPSHDMAQRLMGEILRDSQDYTALAQLLERRLESQDGDSRLPTLLELADVYEDRLRLLDKAEAMYDAALQIEPRELSALKGLERLYARAENFEGLLDNLRRQVELAPTPKQRISLLERIGLLQEEEFVDHAAAAQSFEEVVAIDGGHEGANTALARLYRHLSRFEDVVETLERHAAATSVDARKIDLLMAAGRVLAVDIGSPERAVEVYAQVLKVDDQHAEALGELARLKSTAGDLQAALDAVERLAQHERDPEKKAELWVRAGNLLSEGGDLDGAIVRFKKALDADSRSTEAATALRQIYDQRGDAHGAAEVLLHAIEVADGDHERAALMSELGILYREKLDDTEQAQAAFQSALELDATSSLASAGLALIAFGEQDYEEATEVYESLAGRLGELPRDTAGALCRSIGEAYEQLDQPQKAAKALQRARDLSPDDLSVNEQHARLVARAGDHERAETLYGEILQKFDAKLELSDRVRLQLALSDEQLETGNFDAAVATAKQMLEQRPDDSGAVDRLTRAYEGQESWSEVINLLQLRTHRTDDDERKFELLVKTGEVFLERMNDRQAAAQTFVMALELKPDSRNLLTKLMAVYSDAQDWPRLIEIILRIAEMVDDDAQLAKYYNTAATIAHQELERFDEAADYYEQALSHQAGDAGEHQFEGLVQCLTENQDWDRLERAYETRIERLREAGASAELLAELLDARGEIIQHRLGRLADALRLYEEAAELDPGNESRREMLTAIYTKEPKRFFQQAVSAHRQLLSEDPYRVESLQALRKVYTSAKKPDESWCLCQALRCLKMADVDEEKFFKKYRLTRLAKTKAPVSDDLWRQLIVHPYQDPTLTAIFATLQPAVIGTQSQPLTAFGVSDQDWTDPHNDSVPMGRMLAHVADTLAVHAPPVYHVAHDAGGLSFLFSSPPAIGIGQGARAGGPQQALAFVAGRHLSYFRTGHFLRQFVPTGTGLRAWLMGAIRLVAPQFPVPGNMEPQVRECLDAIKHHLPGPQRDALRSITQKLLDAAPELDMKQWMAGVDLSADRIGFVLSNDLKISNAVIEASPEGGSSVSRKDRLRELLAYSTSEQYFELRKRIGIALGG